MATATTTKDNVAEVGLSFSDLIPPKGVKSAYPALKTLDKQKISMKAIGQEAGGFFVVLVDDRRFAIPPTVAKKIATALDKSKEKGNGRVSATVTALDRGVRLS